MTAKEILKAARELYLDDPRNEEFPEDNLWKDGELLAHLQEAEAEACRRAELINDSTTEDVCVFADFVSPVLLLDKRIRFVQSAYWNGRQLIETSRDQVDMFNQDWTSMTAQNPTHWFPDKDRLRIFRAPSVAGELVLEACRLPLSPVALGGTPEIPSQHHSFLAHWVAHKAYLKQDTETYDPQKAKRHEEMFTLRFGPEKSERDVSDRRNAGRRRVNFANISVG